ncbi:MAG: hypothetical protein AUI14_02245 [Actinobacteria bacterium 13_2_20CM_2_71_6]|nr:MAG: hypothetical protein AUI14_02245 [Actinobacteria bacterium 13_2_20CM_2_71_6]
MALAVHGPDFSSPIVTWVTYVLWLLVLVVEFFAFVNCLTQRAEAFPVVGSVPKAGWLALTGGAFLFSLLLGLVSILGMVAIACALVYILDVRPALRDAVDGHGSW